ncbi:MAG: GNAT family N-acetyltransferase [Desulfobacterales bacterium]
MNPHYFPKMVRLRDGTNLIIRPLLKSDEQKLREYFLRLPPKEVARLKHDITNPTIVEKMIYDLDYDSALPLVAIDNGRIVGSALIKFNPVGWTRHQAEIRGTVDPDYREKGLSTQLVDMMVEISRTMGIDQLTAEVSPALDEAYFLCEKVGFKEAAVLKNFIKDQEGNYEDLVIMVKEL